ncbi:MAG: prepilin peptidase [Actinomycetota bacterium]
MIVPAAALLGLVIGSFLNVVIHRVPLGRSVVWPPSSCPICCAHIRPKDNVPVLSYLLLRGRCRGCNARISLRYPAVELLTGSLFAGAALQFGAGLRLLWALVFICALITLGFIDLEHRLLPNVIVGPAAFAGLVLSVLSDLSGWWIYPVSAVVMSGGLFALALAYPGGMGMGDVKMAGMLGAFLGPYAALAVFLGALSGTLVGGALMAAGRLRRGSALPFGSFMAFGGIVALFAGPRLWSAYLGIFGGA